MPEIHLSVIIPAYNEEKRIAATLRDIYDYLKKQSFESEILLLDDGSRDKTVEVARSLDIPNLKVIDNSENHGKGYVVRQGMLEARGSYRLFTDADNSTKISELEKFWPYFQNGFDVVIGSIEIKGSIVHERAAWYRRTLGKLAKILIRMVLIWEIHDTQRGFKCFTAESAVKIFPKQTIERWGFDMEILQIAKKQGFKIKELPVSWENPAGSKVTLGSYLSSFRELMRIKWNSLRGKYK
ncbi:MAG: glycosyltransferase family 2 protein [Patescibacteria group bacterium]|nr:glycosyltransferase family 2 protein [Patescibacteria group bacterium]